jgi:hypothetical protein
LGFTGLRFWGFGALGIGNWGFFRVYRFWVLGDWDLFRVYGYGFMGWGSVVCDFGFMPRYSGVTRV